MGAWTEEELRSKTVKVRAHDLACWCRSWCREQFHCSHQLPKTARVEACMGRHQQQLFPDPSLLLHPPSSQHCCTPAQQDLKDLAKEVGAAVKASAKKDELIAALLSHEGGGVDVAGLENGGADAAAAGGAAGGDADAAADADADGKHSAIVFALEAGKKVGRRGAEEVSKVCWTRGPRSSEPTRSGVDAAASPLCAVLCVAKGRGARCSTQGQHSGHQGPE
jgi:hypothetical protein